MILRLLGALVVSAIFLANAGPVLADGNVWLAAVNIGPDQSHRLEIEVPGFGIRSASGEILTAEALDAINTFDEPSRVKPQALAVTASKEMVSSSLPPASIAVLQIAN